MAALKLLSFNCCGMPGTGFGRRRAAVARRLGEESPDIAALQEVFTPGEARELAAASGLPHAFHGRRLGTVAGGLVLLSRFPFAEARFVPFEEQGSLFRYSILAKLNRKGFLFARLERPRLAIVAAHLLSNYHERFDGGPYHAWQQSQLGELCDFIAGLDRSVPLVVAGDFNFPPHAAGYKRLLSVSLADLMEGSKRPSMVPKSELDLGWLAPGISERIDYVLVRPRTAFASASCRYVFEGERLSDHLGLWAELEPAS